MKPFKCASDLSGTIEDNRSTIVFISTPRTPELTFSLAKKFLARFDIIYFNIIFEQVAQLLTKRLEDSLYRSFGSLGHH